MIRSFQELDQLLDFVKIKSGRGLQIPGLHFERFPGGWLHCQSETQKMIDNLLEGVSRLPHFFVKQLGDIVIEG